MNKLKLFFFIFLVILGLSGCELSKKQKDIIINEVKDSYFENYSQKTIGEYINLYSESFELKNGTHKYDVSTTKAKSYHANNFDINIENSEIILYSYYDVSNNKNIPYFLCYFLYNTSTKKVEFIWAEVFPKGLKNSSSISFQKKSKDDLDNILKNIIDTVENK